MENSHLREPFDTGVKKIGHQIKSLLITHGMYGTVNSVDAESDDAVPNGSRIEIHVRGKTVSRSFDRTQIFAVYQ